MILVTGGTGLVGAHLLLHLIEEETTIRAIFRSEESKKKTQNLFKLYNKEDFFSKIEWVCADILDIPSLEIAFVNVTWVYHCASLISFDPNKEIQLRQTNIQGTANIVNFCIDKKVQKLCHVSSIAAIGELLPGENFITEKSEWNPEKPHSDYAISKYGAEMEIWRGYQEGLKVVIVNPGIILGTGFWNQSSGLLFKIVKNKLLFYTNGISGYVSVSDVVKIMQQLMKSDLNGERFILVSENKTYKEIIYLIAEKIKVKAPVLEAKSLLLYTAWRMDWLLSKIINSERKISRYSTQSLLNEVELSNEKIKNTLNYTFQPVEETVTEMAVFFDN